MMLLFKLSMPNRGSWNGSWSGEDNYYAVIRKVKSDRDITSLLGSHYYAWPDGWGAEVTVSIINSKEAVKVRKKSRGFYGYDWMVDSLLNYGKIMNSLETVKFLKQVE